MKNLILFTILFFSIGSTFAQEKTTNKYKWNSTTEKPTESVTVNPRVKYAKDSSNFDVKIDPEFFLLGTLSDYLGRFYSIDRYSEFDKYHPSEKCFALYISDYIYQNFNRKIDLEFDYQGRATLKDSLFAQQINNNFFDDSGRFIEASLNTDEKKYSFLLGVYFRYGVLIKDNIYKIQVANSPKNIQIRRILYDLECDKIVFKFLRNYIPSSHIYYFEATPRLIKYFETLDKEEYVINKKEGNDLIISQIDKEIIKSLKVVFD